MANIIYISDAEPKGSGYQGIGVNLCLGLHKMGHKVFYVGLNYGGQEHNFPFCLIPCRDFHEVEAVYQNLGNLERPDVVIVAMDIPIQIRLGQRLMKIRKMPYIGITPLESDPLCFSWAANLSFIDKLFFISQFGCSEAQKAGLVNADHLPIGIDTTSWRLPLSEEKKAILGSVMGLEDDSKFIVLTVADNQERKNLSVAMQIMAKFKQSGACDFRYVMVTREHSVAGWDLRDLAQRLGISKELVIFDRGIPFKLLWSLYAVADAFLLTSKGEGLGLPILEAMATGVPVIGTRAGAITELINAGAGWLIEPEYVNIDVYGNSNRYYADPNSGYDQMMKVFEGIDVDAAVKKAREYVETRTWDIPISILNSSVQELTNGETKIQTDSKPTFITEKDAPAWDAG